MRWQHGSIKYYDDTKLLYTDSGILSGSKTNLRSAPTKTGYTFVGWEIGDKVYNAGSEYTVKANTTVKAKWEAKEKFILSFDSKGGSHVAPISGYEGDTIAITQRPTRSRYNFDGWYLNESCTQKAGSSIKLTADITIYAKWSHESNGGGGGGGGSTEQLRVITFKTIDDVVLGTYERVVGASFDLTKYSYEKDGHVFEGWYSDKELTKKVTSITVIDDVAFYANWKIGESSSKPAAKPDYRPDVLRKDHCAYIVGRSGIGIAPAANITRAEVATIFFRLLTDEVRAANISKTNAFEDVADGKWYNTAISTLAYIGIINGRNETTFAPDAYITRAEFTTIAARFSDAVHGGEDLFTDISNHWAKKHINSAASIGWVNGNRGLFRPDDYITRAEVMTIVNRVLGRQPETSADLLDGMRRWDDNSKESEWYYLAVQEATNSHNCEMKADGIHEKWTELTEDPDWSALEK